MKNYEPSTVIRLPEEERRKRVRKRYREALLSVGKSPDYHIFDLSPDFLAALKDSKAKRYLFGLRHFFANLDDEKRRIFVMDVLEVGRHYQFWYLDEYSHRQYEQILREIVKGVPACLA